MHTGFANQNTNMTTIKRDMGELQRDTQEAKTLSAKAVTIATETKESLTTLEQRVAALEAGHPKRSEGHPQPSFHEGGSVRDFDSLGGEDGDTVIIGGFRNWADREERQEEWSAIHARLPPPLREAISEVIVPTSQCQIVIVKVQRDPKGAKETRIQMLDWGKKFRGLDLKYQSADDPSPRTYNAQPSKPFEMRQRNARNMGILDGFKTLLGPDKAVKLRPDLSNGRIFFRATPPCRKSDGR